MTTAPLGPNRNLKNPAAIEPWNLRDLLIVGIGLPVFFGAMFFAFFFGLGNGN
jgi:hypothetical protein